MNTPSLTSDSPYASAPRITGCMNTHTHKHTIPAKHMCALMCTHIPAKSYHTRTKQVITPSETDAYSLLWTHSGYRLLHWIQLQHALPRRPVDPCSPWVLCIQYIQYMSIMYFLCMYFLWIYIQLQHTIPASQPSLREILLSRRQEASWAQKHPCNIHFDSYAWNPIPCQAQATIFCGHAMYMPDCSSCIWPKACPA